ncbi:MAG: hypothetical protein ACLGIZ_08130 [Acidimicrobiia bacterium]|jgi:hypothetical protein
MDQLPTPDQLDRLAHDVVLDGFEVHALAVAELVGLARRLGIRPVLADVLSDGSTPRPVRERALGLLLVAVAAHAATPMVTRAVSSAA